MLRLVFVLAIVGAFAGTVYYVGEQMGLWEPVDPPPPSREAALTGPDDDVGDGSASGNAGKRQSAVKKRWIRDANALCRRAGRETSRLKWPTTNERAESLIERLALINARYQDALASLKPVKAGRTKFRKVLALFEKDERVIDEYLSALRNHQAPPSFLEVLGRLSSTADRESTLLSQLGATKCGVAFSVPYF